MRLRKKPWVPEAIKKYQNLVFLQELESYKGNWQQCFNNVQPLHLEVGTGRGKFITTMAQKYPGYNFIGIESQIDVIYDVAVSVEALQLPNIRLIKADAAGLCEWFAPEEIDKIYLNFSDPWPKARHAKRRLTHTNFLNLYKQILKTDAIIQLKTDNDGLFAFTLQEVQQYGGKILTFSTDLYNADIYNPAPTEYELKFVAKGKNINYCEFCVE